MNSNIPAAESVGKGSELAPTAETITQLFIMNNYSL